MTTTNPPAQDQPVTPDTIANSGNGAVTPQAEEWSQKLYDVNSDFYYSNGAINFPKIIESFRQELKSVYNNGVEEGKKLMVVEVANELSALDYREYKSAFHYKDIWGEDCPTNELPNLIVYRGIDLQNLLISLLPNQHKE